jgi:hypothetical protein
MKLTLPVNQGNTLVFEDGEQHSIAKPHLQHSWYKVSIVDSRGNTTELCHVDKSDIKRLAKAS